MTLYLNRSGLFDGYFLWLPTLSSVALMWVNIHSRIRFGAGQKFLLLLPFPSFYYPFSLILSTNSFLSPTCVLVLFNSFESDLFSDSQIYAVICVFSQYQDYSSGRSSNDERRYSRSITTPYNQVEVTTAFIVSSVADPPTTEEVITNAPNGRCSSIFKESSPTKSTSINSSTFIPKDDGEEVLHDVDEDCLSAPGLPLDHEFTGVPLTDFNSLSQAKKPLNPVISIKQVT